VTRRALEWDGTAVTATRRRAGSVGDWLAAQLAESAADLLTDPAKIAATHERMAHDCVLLFTATHPRRQWCSPSRCGNRARVARYYRRHKP
jgi:predicted RNA-binding Zn ribbon-like protein